MDYRAIYSSIYDRAAVHADGTALRALVGSVFRAKDPLNFNGKTLPYLMWRDGTIGGLSGEMRPISGAWWIYIGAVKDNRLLWQIAGALETLYGYTNKRAIDHGWTAITFIGQPFFDASLKLQGMEVRIEYRDRG